MSRFALSRENWFLVIPTFILGLVVLYTISRLYAAGDVHRAIETVISYQVAGQPPLDAFLSGGRGDLSCEAEVVSRFYGTLDVSCRPPASTSTYRWRVHVGQRAFAPLDQRTRDLMQRYAPDVFGAPEAAVEESPSGERGE